MSPTEIPMALARRRPTVLLTTALLCTIQATAGAEVIYFNSHDGNVGRWVSPPGTTNPVGSLTAQGFAITECYGLAFDPARNALMLADSDSSAATPTRVFSMDATTGVATHVFDLWTNDDVEVGACVGDTLFVYQYGTVGLAGYNLITGNMTLQGPTSIMRAVGVDGPGQLHAMSQFLDVAQLNHLGEPQAWPLMGTFPTTLVDIDVLTSGDFICSRGGFSQLWQVDHVTAASVILVDNVQAAAAGCPGGLPGVAVRHSTRPVQAPWCSVDVAAGVLSGNIAMDVASVSLHGERLDLTFEHSTDAGASFRLCTPALIATVPNPAAARPHGHLTFDWDTVADMVAFGGVETVPLRVRATDLTTGLVGSCLFPVDVDNLAMTTPCTGLCGDCNMDGGGPNILDALAAARIASGIGMPSTFQRGCCDVNSTGRIEILDALMMARIGAMLPAAPGCP